MEKDKIDNSQIKQEENSNNLIMSYFHKIFEIILKIFNKLVAQVHFLDPKDNTKQRIISSIILFPIAIYAIFFSQKLFTLLAIAVAILMSWEWVNITKTTFRVDKGKKRWQFIGFFYILIPIYSVIEIRNINVDILFWMFGVIWTTDIFAFFSGKIFGGPKLAPTISPNKTWSGLAGGIITSVIIGFLCSYLFNGSEIFFMFTSMCLSILEQISDICESKIKRIFGVKDSGNIIPGHGGIMDRLDGIILVAPAVLILTEIVPGQF